jgi:alpha-galactosidase
VDFPRQADSAGLAFFANGWQSWSHTGAYPAKGSMRHSNLGILQEPMVINTGTPTYRSAGRFSSDFFGVLGDRRSRDGFLLGFLSQKDHFGSLTADLRAAPAVRLWANGDHARLDPGMSIRTDWAVWQPVQLDDPDPLAAYLETVAEVHKVKALPPAPAGWCSWYYYYEDISSRIIHENLAQIKGIGEKLPLDLVQIDDGFEAAVGDWLEFKPEFRGGVAPLAQEIKSAGMTPGLWLAPFILHPRSRLAGEHPDWLLRRRNGKLSKPGFVWNSLGAALDLTVPDALEYACQVLDVAVRQWGFPYLKLDFLYAAALKGQYHDPTRTRAQVLRGGMEALRRTVGEDTLLVGCGAPLGSVLGLVQTMRIGADVAPSWKPSYFGISLPIRNEPHMPSARNSIQNILTRAPLHRRWWVNDPDCLLVRPDSKLTLDEVRSLATAIGLTGGSILLSDEMQSLPEDRLEIAGALLPIIEERAQVLDWMDAQTPQKLRLDMQGATGAWTTLTFFNWHDSDMNIALFAEDFRLPGQDYWVRSFWDNKVWPVKKGEPLFSGKLAPHAPLVLALRPAAAKQPCYLGSSLHISQGQEVAGWKANARGVSLDISAGRQAQAVIDLYLPKSPAKAELDGKSLSWQIIDSDSKQVYRFTMDIQNKADLQITYS